MEVYILDKNRFIDKVLPIVEESEDSFFISILDPETGIEPLMEDTRNYRSWAFFDLEEDMDNGNNFIYKAISEKQAKQIFEFIKENSDKKKLFVHCSVGISRSAAIGAFVHEYFGGAYKELLKKFPHILPNGRVTKMLRMYERIDYIGDDTYIKF